MACPKKAGQLTLTQVFTTPIFNPGILKNFRET